MTWPKEWLLTVACEGDNTETVEFTLPPILTAEERHEIVQAMIDAAARSAPMQRLTEQACKR